MGAARALDLYEDVFRGRGQWGMPIDEFIADLNARMELSEEGDPTDLLSDEAVEVADSLWREAMASPGSEWYIVGIVIAWMHWSRGLAGERPDEHELSVATCLFAVLSELDPAVIPSAVHDGIHAVRGDAIPKEPAPVWTILRHLANTEVFTRAIDLLGRAVPAMPSDDSRLPGLLDCLIIMRSTRFLRGRDLADMSIVIDAMRRRLALAPTGPDDSPTAATSVVLASWLQHRYERNADEYDLAEAIAIVRDALDGVLLTGDDGEGAQLLSQLCYLQLMEYQRGGSVVELDEGIEAGRRAAQLAATNHPHLASIYGHLGLALRQRYQQSGDLRYLDEAVTFGRLGVAAGDIDDPYLPMLLSGLGLALRARYRHLGATGDLDEAISVSHTAVEAAGDTHPDLGSCLSNLTLALRVRFDCRRDLSDLDKAIEVGRRAVVVTPAAHHNRPRTLMNLCLALRARFEITGRVADIEESIAAVRRAIDETDKDIPLRSDAVNNLGLALRARYHSTRDLTDLDAAVAAHQSAVGSTAVDSFERSPRLLNLANAWYLRHTVTASTEDIDNAASAWANVASSQIGQADSRLSAARQCADIAGYRDGPAAALPMLRIAVELLPLVAWRGLGRADQIRQLTHSSGSVAVDAGATACAAGQADEACELLEQGRAVLWQQLLATRTSLDALREIRPALADALATCRDEIEAHHVPAPY